MTRDASLLPPSKGFISFLMGNKSANKGRIRRGTALTAMKNRNWFAKSAGKARGGKTRRIPSKCG
jgi:hypothetical protein